MTQARPIRCRPGEGFGKIATTGDAELAVGASEMILNRANGYF